MAINIFKKDGKEEAAKKTAEPASKKAKKNQPAAKESKPEISADAARVLRGAHVTEKAARLAQTNKYVFKVDGKATKTEIAKAIAGAYKVKVVGVNIVNIPDKSRRRGRGVMVKPGYRKAIVAIKEGQTIEILPK